MKHSVSKINEGEIRTRVQPEKGRPYLYVYLTNVFKILDRLSGSIPYWMSWLEKAKNESADTTPVIMSYREYFEINFSFVALLFKIVDAYSLTGISWKGLFVYSGSALASVSVI